MRLFRLPVWLGLAASLALAACDSPKQREQQYVEHGKALYDSGDLVKAALEFKNALQINPVGVDAQYYMGLILEKQNDLGGAANAFRRVADEAPQNFDAHVRAGQYALMGGDVEAAGKYGDDLIALAPNKPDGYVLKAAVLMIKNRVADAGTAAAKALSLDPDNVNALIVMASKEARSSNPDGALALTEQGLKSHPGNKDLLLLKLRLMFDQHRAGDVIAVLQELHHIDPVNPSYTIDLANQLAAANRIDDAENVFKQALDAGEPSDLLISGFASFLIAKKSPAEAIEQIKVLATNRPQASKYTFLLEQLYLNAGKPDEADALMRKLIAGTQVAQDRLQASVELARIAFLKGNRDDALAQVNDVIKRDPNNQSAFLLRATMMLAQAKYDNAITDARSALHGDINSIGGLKILAAAYTAMGQRDLAIDTLRSLQRLAPTDVSVRLQLATMLSSSAPGEAMDQLDAAIALRPDAPELKMQKAEFLIRTGAADKAELIGQDLAKDPKLAGMAHRILGKAALARTDYRTAITELGQAEQAGQPFADIGPVLIQAYVKAGQPEAAGDLLQKRIAADAHDTDAMILLAALRDDAGHYDDAERLLRGAIAAKPDAPAAYVDLSQLLTKQNRIPDAIKVLTDATAKFPGDNRIATYRAVALDTSGDLEGARTAYTQILAQWPDNMIAANNLAALVADAWPNDAEQLGRARQLAEKFRNSADPLLLDTLGWVMVRQGNLDDAMILLQTAASQLPDNQQIRFHYAAALQGKGLNAKAKEAYAKAVAGNPVYRGIDEARKQLATLN
jgi:tetratricopeptide (TPR) repeat protein